MCLAYRPCPTVCQFAEAKDVAGGFSLIQARDLLIGAASATVLMTIAPDRFGREWFLVRQRCSRSSDRAVYKKIIKVASCSFVYKPCAKVARIPRFVLLLMFVDSVTYRFFDQELSLRCITTFEMQVGQWSVASYQDRPGE